MTSAEAGSSTGGIGFFEVLVETENAQFSVRGASCADLLQRHHKSRVMCVCVRARGSYKAQEFGNKLRSRSLRCKSATLALFRIAVA